MLRRVWFGLLFASAALSVATFGLWIVSLLVAVRLDYTWIDKGRPTWLAVGPYAAVSPHQLTLGLQRIDYAPRHAFVPIESVAPPGLSWRRSTPTPAAVGQLPARLGFDGLSQTRLNTGYGDVRATAVVLPLWFLIGVTAAAPAWVLWRAAGRLRRRSPTACRSCGYDLRASPGRCPECGAAAATP